MSDGVTLHGRALARNGAVTLINDTITAAHCAVASAAAVVPGALRELDVAARAAGRPGRRRQPGPVGRTAPSSRRSSRPGSTRRAPAGRRAQWTRAQWTKGAVEQGHQWTQGAVDAGPVDQGPVDAGVRRVRSDPQAGRRRAGVVAERLHRRARRSRCTSSGSATSIRSWAPRSPGGGRSASWCSSPSAGRSSWSSGAATHSFSLTDVPLTLALVFTSGTHAFVAVHGRRRSSRCCCAGCPPVKFAFNLAQFALVTSVLIVVVHVAAAADPGFGWITWGAVLAGVPDRRPADDRADPRRDGADRGPRLARSGAPDVRPGPGGHDRRHG